MPSILEPRECIVDPIHLVPFANRLLLPRRQTIAKLRAEVRELKHERSAGGGGAESLRGEVYELSKALASARGEVDELSGQSRGLLGQRDAALVEAGSLRAALALAHSERDALSTELEAMHRVCGISPIGMRGGTTGEDKPWPIAEDKPWGKEQWSPLTPPSSTAESMSGVHRGGSGSAGGGVAGEREEAAELMEWAGSALYDELSATRVGRRRTPQIRPDHPHRHHCGALPDELSATRVGVTHCAPLRPNIV